MNPPIASADDVYYSMDDLMQTPPPNSQATTVAANWDSDWNLTSEHWFQASATALDPCFSVPWLWPAIQPRDGASSYWG